MHSDEQLSELSLQILEIHGSMRNLTIKFALVSEKNYDKVVAKIRLYTLDEMQELFTWLNGLKAGYYARVAQIYRMPPNPEITWDNYKVLEVEGLQEQYLMASASGKLRDAWRKPYKPTRKIREHKSKETQPEIPEGNAPGIAV